jgi:DUF4097 and DUF4098 domain-containing protein YvlB
MTIRREAVLRVAAGLLAVALVSGPAQAASFERQFTFQADELTLVDLIGAVHVEGHSGSDFVVKVNVQGADADEKRIQFETDTGRRSRLVVQFPVRDQRDYVYPRLGSRSRTTIAERPDSEGGDWLHTLLDLATGDRIQVRGRSWGDALELWADVVVQVPAGRETIVRLGVGDIEATGVAGDLDLRIKSGATRARDVKGTLLVDTGSGSVDVQGVQGDVTVDTGSGRVEVADVRADGRVLVDTGSGSVDVTGVRAEDLSVDTGSGRVDLSDVDVKQLAVDTGSGGVEGDRVAADEMVVDTGSGGVDLGLVRMGRGPYGIDTGSGGIRLEVPADISADFDVETGSGSIVADLEGVDLDRRHRREAHFTVGDGDARVRLSTGSGSVRITQRTGTATRR